LSFSLPKWRLTRWLTHSGQDTPADIRAALIASLFGTLPIFAGGVINTLMISGVVRNKTRRKEQKAKAQKLQK